MWADQVAERLDAPWPPPLDPAALRGVAGQKEALQHLARVNQWSLQQAAAYAREELALTAERSKHRYQLDLWLLEREFGIKLPPEGSPHGGGGLLRKLMGVGR